MYARSKSQKPGLNPFNPESERILGTKIPSITMAEDLHTTKPMKECLSPSIYTSVSCICIPNMSWTTTRLSQVWSNSYHPFMDLPMRTIQALRRVFRGVFHYQNLKLFHHDALRLTLFLFSKGQSQILARNIMCDHPILGPSAEGIPWKVLPNWSNEPNV